MYHTLDTYFGQAAEHACICTLAVEIFQMNWLSEFIIYFNGSRIRMGEFE